MEAIILGRHQAVVQSLSHVWPLVTPWTVARQAPLSSTLSWSLLKLMSIELYMPSNHLILCCPLLLPPSVFPRIRVFSNESALLIRWPKYWSFSFNISASNEYSGFQVSEDNYSAPSLSVSSNITEGSSFWIWGLSKTPIWGTTLRPVYPSILLSRG